MSGSIGINSDPRQMVSNGDMSADVYSIGVDLQSLNIYSIQAVFSGAPVGNFILQISNDLVSAGKSSDPASNVVNWDDYTYSSLNISAAGSFTWKVTTGSERWVRIKYTRTSGTGALNVTFSGKN